MAVTMWDVMTGAIGPVAIYWLYSGLCVLMGSTNDHRLASKEEAEEKNLVSKGLVVRRVLLLQAVQVAITVIVFQLDDQSGTAGQSVTSSPWAIARQVAVAALVLDAWQYWVHRIQHMSTFLYQNVHYLHHTMIVPYPYGSQFHHPVEDAVNTLGVVLTHVVSGMSPTTSMVFFSVATIKGIDDHCALWFPRRNPFHRWFDNNSAFHAAHHQLYGLKYNFSSPFTTLWDRLMGTYLPCSVERTEGGVGWQMRPANTRSKKD